MPYGISQNQSDCSGWAAVMREPDGSYTTIGCHQTKTDAIAQMVAASIADKMDPIGEVGQRDVLEDLMPEQPEMPEEELPDQTEQMVEGLADMVEMGLNPRQFAMYEFYETLAEEFGMFDQGIGANGAHYVAESPFAAEGMICSNCVLFEGGRKCEVVDGDISPNGICKLWVIREELLPVEPAETSVRVEVRAVDLSAPAFMRASARRGLALHEEGKSGSGLMPQTVEDARKMAAGQISEAKWRKIAPWIARHIDDLDAVQGDEITAGLVAMLLWGGGSSKSSARRAQAYAESIVERLDSGE